MAAATRLLDHFRRNSSSRGKRPVLHETQSYRSDISDQSGELPASSSSMDILHVGGHHHGKKDKKEKTSNSNHASPRIGPSRPAKVEIDMESPPLMFYGTVQQSTGALLSARLKLEVIDPEVKISSMTLRLMATETTKKPVSEKCPECASRATEIRQWTFLSEPTTFKRGLHEFPFSHLLLGHLPTTSVGPLGDITYDLMGTAVTALENLDFSRPLKVMRALPTGDLPRTSIRVFPPTNLKSIVEYPAFIHPVGQHTALMRLSGVAERDGSYQRRWTLKKVSWRLEETLKIISPACPKHSAKVGGQGKGVQHTETRIIGSRDLKEGWKSDFSYEGGGSIELEFPFSIASNIVSVRDVVAPTGYESTHQLVMELIVAEEVAPVKLSAKFMAPTGIARVLRMKFSMVVTERAGMGISWDEEQPPLYDMVPGSPPGYGKIDETNGMIGELMRDSLNNDQLSLDN